MEKHKTSIYRTDPFPDTNDRLTTHTYDANGNTTLSEATVEGLKSNASDIYDFKNRLIRRTYPAGMTLDYVYNAQGTRISKTKRDGVALLSSKLFVVDNQNLTGYVQTLEEWTAEGYGFFELDKVYDYGLDLIAQTQFEPDPQNPMVDSLKSMAFFCYDGHGSVRALTDETGMVTDTYTYDAFGIQLSRSGSTDNAYRYCGEYFDIDLGQYYLRARYMNPETGRFHTMDTFEGNTTDPFSLHKYLYAHANPVMASDPSGLFFMMDVMAAIEGGMVLTACFWAGYSMGIGDYHETSVHLVEAAFWGYIGITKTAKGVKWWSEARQVRVVYKQAARRLSDTVSKMRASGKSSKEIADKIVDIRNQTKLSARAISDPEAVKLAERISMRKHGNELGPTLEQLLVKNNGSYDKVIEHATHTNWLVDLLFLVF